MDINKYDFTSVVEESFTLYAKWVEKTDTKYTIKHYKQNIDETAFVLAETETKAGTTNRYPLVEPKEYEGFTYREGFDEYTDSKTTTPTFDQLSIKADGSLNINVYYLRNEYNVTFNDNDHNTVTDPYKNVLYQSKITAPTSPVTNGYTFDSWLIDNKKYTFNTMPANDLNLEATWIENSNYIITYSSENLNDGTDYSQYPVSVKNIANKTGVSWNQSGLLPEVVMTRPGYHLAGWYYLDSNGKEIRIDENTTFKEIANNEEPNNNTVTLTAHYAQGPIDNSDPEKDNPITINYEIKTYNNALDTLLDDQQSGGSISDNTISVLPVTGEPNEVKATKNNGFNFIGWKENLDVDTPISKNLSFTPSVDNTSKLFIEKTYYAVFAEDTNKILSFKTITYRNNKTDVSPYLGGDITGITSQSVAPVTGTSQEVIATAKEGYSFDGWYKNNTKIETNNGVLTTTLIDANTKENGAYVDSEIVARFSANKDRAYKVNAYIMESNGTFGQANKTVNITDQETDMPIDLSNIKSQVGDMITLSNFELVSKFTNNVYKKKTSLTTGMDYKDETIASVSFTKDLIIDLYYDRLIFTITLEEEEGSFTDDNYDRKFNTNKKTGEIIGTYLEPTGEDQDKYFSLWKDDKNNLYVHDSDNKLHNYKNNVVGTVAKFKKDTTLTALYGQFKYAVSLLGIGSDDYKDKHGKVVSAGNGNTSMTFGPALGGDYVAKAKPAHIASDKETENDKCIHNHSWAEIVSITTQGKSKCFEKCINNQCTQSIVLAKNNTTTIFNPKARSNIKGDGPSALYSELFQYSNTGAISYENLRWHPNNPNFTKGDNYGTTIDGWGASRIRAMLNGVDTDNSDNIMTDTASNKYSPSASTDINKSASIYTSTNNLFVTLPEVLQNNIVAKNVKYECTTAKGYAILNTYDKLWLLAHQELGGRLTDYEASDVNKTGYTKFAGLGDYANTVRKVKNITSISDYNPKSGDPQSWLRSRYWSNTWSPLYLTGSGNLLRYYSAWSEKSVSFCFILKGEPNKLIFDLNGGQIDGNTANNVLEFDGDDLLIKGQYSKPTKDGLELDHWVDKDNVSYVYEESGNRLATMNDSGHPDQWVSLTEDMTLTAVYKNTFKYAVMLYGIGVDSYKDSNGTEVTGYSSNNHSMTFGPALYGDYVTTSKPAHVEKINESESNGGKCIHNHTWDEIVNDCNNGNAQYYSQCAQNHCTKTVQLNKNETTTILNPIVPVNITGDGPSALYSELTSGSGILKLYENLRWHPNGQSYSPKGKNNGTNAYGWGTSRVRAMLNGADTDNTDNIITDLDTNQYSDTANNDTNKSASIYSSTNNLFKTLPSILQENIVPKKVNYIYKKDDNDTTIYQGSVYDNLWLLSASEVGLTNPTNDEKYELLTDADGTQHSYDAFRNSGNGVGNPVPYKVKDITAATLESEHSKLHLRSVDTYSFFQVRNLYTDGTFSYEPTDSEYSGIGFGFVIAPKNQ